MNLRIDPLAQVTLARRGTGQRRTLAAVSADGMIQHRIETNEGFDTSVVDALDPVPGIRLATIAPDTDQGVTSLSAVRNARLHWHERDTGHHLNDILSDGGKTRANTLPHVGKGKAWPILPQVLTSFIRHLIQSETGHSQIVPGDGLMQAALMRRGSVKGTGSLVVARGDRTTFALDLAQVDKVWGVNAGPVAQLEIYNHSGHAIAIFGADPNGNIARWNTLVASLPPPAYGLTKG